MRPPQIAMRVGGFSCGTHRPGAPIRVDGDNLHRMEVVGREAQLPTEKAEGAADDMSADADLRVLSESGRPTTTTTTTTLTPLNPIAAKIASKPNLSSKLTAMLPIDPLTGRTMTLNTASLGFKNQGQFVAALHVSQNLGIPFTELPRS